MSAPDWLVARPIAHRGLHDRSKGIVENTISAAEAAIAGGYAIECDVQGTADGGAVVFHDHTLDRTTDAGGPVRARREPPRCVAHLDHAARPPARAERPRPGAPSVDGRRG